MTASTAMEKKNCMFSSELEGKYFLNLIHKTNGLAKNKNKENFSTSTTNLKAQATLALLLTTITMYTLLILM